MSTTAPLAKKMNFTGFEIFLFNPKSHGHGVTICSYAEQDKGCVVFASHVPQPFISMNVLDAK